jgi:hypothetical protein
LNSIIDKLESAIREIAANNGRVKLLETIAGIAPYSALYLSTMLDDVGRKIPSRQLHILA